MKSPQSSNGLAPDINEVFSSLHDGAYKVFESLQSIWSDMGIYGEAREARLETVRSHVMRLYQDMLEEEESTKLLIVQRIEGHSKDLRKLSKELYGEATDIPNLERAPLYQIEKCLKEKLKELQRLKDARVEILQEYQRRHEEVRSRLGKRDVSPYEGGITELEIEAFKCRVHLFEQERDRLQACYEESKEAIQKIFEELKMSPRTPFEQNVLSPDKYTFVLSAENMAALKKLHQNLEQLLSDSKDYATELRERLSNLWERLEINAEEREAFLNSHQGYSYPTIEALNVELKRCEVLKKANIEKFVCQLREEIVGWWDRCCFSQSQRSQFQPFYYTDFTEDVLELHELEVKKLREFYETNRDIYQLAEKREELWSKLLDLEARASDPNRLFNNRGGQLLREEKERKTIAKTLPKVESELKERLLAYEQENLSPFLMNGENLLAIIDELNREREGQKELLKIQKKETRNHLLEVESKLGSRATTPTSVQRGKIGPLTPNVPGGSKTMSLIQRSAPPKALTATLKRKAGHSPRSNVSKKSRGDRKSSEKKSGNKSGPRYSTSKIRRYGKVPSRIQEVPSSSKTRRNILSTVPTDNFSICSGIGPYSEFQVGPIINSSLMPCSSLTEPARVAECGEGLSELCCAEKLSSGEEHTCFRLL